MGSEVSLQHTASWCTTYSSQNWKDTGPRGRGSGMESKFLSFLSSRVLTDAAFHTGDLPAWVHDSAKLCLIGDAAHAMTPYLAQGAAMGSRVFTQMSDGPEQQERDEWLLAHPGIQEDHRNIRSDRDFLDWLFGYDAYKVLDGLS
jgi:hypothetical protein